MFFVGRIRKAIVIHVFGEIFELKIYRLFKGYPHSLFSENVARQVLLARNKDEDPFGFFWLLAACYINDQQKVPQRN